VHDIDEVEYHPTFRPHHQVEIAQADVEIDNRNGIAALGDRCVKGDGRCGLAHPALTRCQNQNVCHLPAY
jgi:hypothetical protein